ncbi:putative P-type phospholipid transporter [Helianthus annuus]|nr:putative P-type phospholipid transporter [Helianthus annuus]KAJ0516140.1 putative P-type phospholipid transporter [Helianthus annuus]KAJ0684166.1 putative P-type phospholipid transporter [Helianthus annuus]
MGLRTFCLAWRELNEWRVAEVCQRLEHDLEILGVAAIEDRLQDICIEKFLEYFWWCWDRLKAKCSDDMPMPSLFHLVSHMGTSIQFLLCIISVSNLITNVISI